jgi:hypothetical protein
MNTVLTQSQNLRPNDPDYIKRNIADGIVNFIFLRLMGYTLGLLIAIIIIINDLEAVYSMIPLICTELFSLIVLCLYQQRLKGNDTLYMFIFENFIHFIFLITVIINIQVGFDPMFLLIIPTFHLFVNLMSINYQGRQFGMPVFFIINITFYLSLLFVILKVRKLIDISFYVCFWPFYLFAFLALIFIVRNFIDFWYYQKYQNATGITVMFRLGIPILGFSFIGTHILAIYYLGCKDLLIVVSDNLVYFKVFNILNCFICVFSFYLFTFVYTCLISNKLM